MACPSLAPPLMNRYFLPLSSCAFLTRIVCLFVLSSYLSSLSTRFLMSVPYSFLSSQMIVNDFYYSFAMNVTDRYHPSEMTVTETCNLPCLASSYQTVCGHYLFGLTWTPIDLFCAAKFCLF
jgi:hypothetical protein